MTVLVGDHVELVRDRELDVAPGVGEQLGQLRRDGARSSTICGRRGGGTASSARSCARVLSGRRRSAAASGSPRAPRPRPRAPGQKATSTLASTRRGAPGGCGRWCPGRRCFAGRAAGRRCRKERSESIRSAEHVEARVQVLVERRPDHRDHDLRVAAARSASVVAPEVCRRPAPAAAARPRRLSAKGIFPALVGLDGDLLGVEVEPDDLLAGLARGPDRAAGPRARSRR